MQQFDTYKLLQAHGAVARALTAAPENCLAATDIRRVLERARLTDEEIAGYFRALAHGIPFRLAHRKENSLKGGSGGIVVYWALAQRQYDV